MINQKEKIFILHQSKINFFFRNHFPNSFNDKMSSSYFFLRLMKFNKLFCNQQETQTCTHRVFVLQLFYEYIKAMCKIFSLEPSYGNVFLDDLPTRFPDVYARPHI